MIIAALAIILFSCLAGALLWMLAVHALPLWCGAIAAMAAHHAGASLFGALLAGLAAGIATLVLGHWLAAAARSPAARAGVGLVFALPAAIAGYYAASGIATTFGLNGIERSSIMGLAALATGIAAWGGALRFPRQPHPTGPVRA